MKMKTKRSLPSRIINSIGLILCLLLLPILIVGMTMFIQTLIEPDVPPNFMGYTPAIVSSGSMEPTFSEKDLVIIKATRDTSLLTEGTIICYFSEGSLVTHKIVDLEYNDTGGVMYVTQGDANNAPDTVRVSPADIIGVYHTHIPKLGGFALFMQTREGMTLCVVLPLLALFILYSVMDRRHQKALLRELEQTQAAVEQSGDDTAAEDIEA